MTQMSVGEMVLDDFVSGVEDFLPKKFAVGAANSETQGGFTMSLLSKINSHPKIKSMRAPLQFLIISQKEKIDYFGP